MRPILYGSVIPVAAMAFLWFAAAQNGGSNGGARQGPQQREPEGITQGVMCDTQQQAERYVDLLSGGAIARNALDTVNGEAGSPVACAPATVMYTAGKPLAEKLMQGQSASIVEITVVAAVDGEHWMAVDRQVQYTVMLQPGVNV